ncbi:hypothetical protein [Streptomyces longwoodensis]|uniref:hypothetical protein n=1 Tax=Streptomyces longwoodensis TaxID=68231 RepID=UPI0033D0D1D8
MPDSPPQPPHDALTPVQRTMVEAARADLALASVAPLVELDAAQLILLVERLRGRLHTVLSVLDEVTDDEPGE